MSGDSVLVLFAEKRWPELYDRDPLEIATELTATLALMFGPAPSELWKLLESVVGEPCGEPGCNCELLRPEIFKALSVARDDYREQVLTRGQS